jgi:hypothetical protein
LGSIIEDIYASVFVGFDYSRNFEKLRCEAEIGLWRYAVLGPSSKSNPQIKHIKSERCLMKESLCGILSSLVRLWHVKDGIIREVAEVNVACNHSKAGWETTDFLSGVVGVNTCMMKMTRTQREI